MGGLPTRRQFTIGPTKAASGATKHSQHEIFARGKEIKRQLLADVEFERACTEPIVPEHFHIHLPVSSFGKDWLGEIDTLRDRGRYEGLSVAPFRGLNVQFDFRLGHRIVAAIGNADFERNDNACL
jgi:hypothetical protein